MSEASEHLKKPVEDTAMPSLTTTQLGIDVQCAPAQLQGNGENSDNTNSVYIVLQGILYSLERNSDETDDEESDGVKRINDGCDIWEKVLELRRMLTLPSTSPDYQSPIRLIKKIHKGEIKKVFGSEILEEEREIVLTCILIISLCCGAASLGNEWQLIALRLISLLPIHYIKFFLQKMELHLNNLNADILKALVDRFKTDEDFVDLLHQIFARQEKLKNESNPSVTLSILTSTYDKTEDYGEIQDKDMLLPDKALIAILNDMIVRINPNLNQKERAGIMAVIMNKKDGTKIAQSLSKGIDLNPNYIAKINEQMRSLGIPNINTQQLNGKTIYKR